MAVKSVQPRMSAGKPAHTGRSAGRPRSGSQPVGREALIEVTCELLKSHPPSAVTRALVARHSNVDPSLIRYYFRDRDSLMVAAAESIVARFRSIVAAAYARTDNSARDMLMARIGALLEPAVDLIDGGEDAEAGLVDLLEENDRAGDERGRETGRDDQTGLLQLGFGQWQLRPS